MRIKVVQPNENGKIELTVKELQDLLNEAYHQGWNDKPFNYYGNNYPSITYLDNAIATKQDSLTGSASIGTVRGDTSSKNSSFTVGSGTYALEPSTYGGQ